MILAVSQKILKLAKFIYQLSNITAKNCEIKIKIWALEFYLYLRTTNYFWYWLTAIHHQDSVIRNLSSLWPFMKMDGHRATNRSDFYTEPQFRDTMSIKETFISATYSKSVWLYGSWFIFLKEGTLLLIEILNP